MAVNVTIRRLEVATCDPDAFFAGLVARMPPPKKPGGSLLARALCLLFGHRWQRSVGLRPLEPEVKVVRWPHWCTRCGAEDGV